MNFFNLDKQALANSVKEFHIKTSQIKQIFSQVYRYRNTDPLSYEFLNRETRQYIKATFKFELLKIASEHPSADGTVKWLLQLDDGNHIETVYIPEENRGTLCVSSQVGCHLTCDFCQTGKQGFNRNLTTAEIISQVYIAREKHHITNIVFMGMGEPLYNLDNVIPALRILLDDNAFNLSKHRVTVSTSGVVPQMLILRDAVDCALAVSLHAPNDRLRDILVPLNKKYNLSALMSTCQQYFPKESKRQIVFEYVMLENVNDSDDHAKALVPLLKDISCKINLIPFNPFSGTLYKRSSDTRIDMFERILKDDGIITTTRKTRGDDVAAACGQLRGEFRDKTRRRERFEESIR